MGSTSGRPSRKMRNISAVHRPIPRTTVSRSTTSSSFIEPSRRIDGTVPSMRRLGSMNDEEVVERLTVVRGIGRWTAEMFLIFRLGRPDVLPIDDYGVRKGFQR